MILVLIIVGTLWILFHEVILDDKPYNGKWDLIRLISLLVGIFIASILMSMSLKLLGI